MYINKIDDFVDKLLDDFFSNIFKSNKTIENILKEKNFVKYQKEINDILIDYHKSINYDKLKDTLINQDNTKIFDEIIKKYIMLYLFLYIAGFYNDTTDTFSNNIVEFTKNQLNFKLKINNFFNSESNAMIIGYYNIIKNISNIFEVYEDENKVKLLTKRTDFKPAFVFLNSLGAEIIDNTLRNIKDDKLKTHNLIKLILLIDIYQKTDKKEISQILENTTIDGEEYTYIDVVIPTRDNIDYVTVESLLNRREILSGYTNTFWNYIIENQENLAKINLLEETIENKILHLINSGILIPVLDDFLLYHKETERYDKNVDANILKDMKKREESKIKYIVTKIDSTTDLYSKNTKDPKIKSNIMKNFFTPMNNRKTVLVNNNEEVKILAKLVNQGPKAMEGNEYFNELANYRVYPYVNFKDFKDYGFSIQLNKTVPAVRSVSFETSGDFRQNRYSPVQMRVGAKEEYVNIVGFVVPSNINPIECSKVKDIKNIHNYGKNGYDLTMSYVAEGTIKNTPHKSSIFWLFDLNKDSTKEDNYEQGQKLTEQEQIKKLISNFYEDILVRVYEEFSRKIDSYKEISLQKAKSILEKLEKRTVNINRNRDLYNDIENKIISKTIIKEEKYDDKEDIFYGLSGTSKKLPVYDKKKDKVDIIQLDVSKSKDKEGDEEIEKVEGICQHNITWEYITKLKKIDESKYQERIYEFIQNYVIENNESDFVCKSCSTQIDVKKFVTDGTFDDDTGRFVTFSMPFDTPLEEMSEYEKYKIAIRSLDKVIEKIAIINNIPAYIGNMFNSRVKRKNISKDLIDLVIDNNHFLKKNLKERGDLVKSYGLSKDLSNLFVFDFENNIFVFSSKEKDFYKNIKYNNILAYIILLLCLDVNESQLGFMMGDKKGLCNMQVYDKYGHVLFDNIKIRKNKAGDLIPIKNYKILCYMIYLMSCMMTKYSMWYYDDKENVGGKKKFNPMVQKIIVHTIVDLLNSILENSTQKKAGIIFEIITTKFYLKLNTFLNNDELYKRLLGDDAASIASDKKTFVLPKTALHILEKYEPMIEFDLPLYNKVQNKKYIPKKKTTKPVKYTEINNITNCEDGKFHKWVPQGKNFTCEYCAKNMAELELANKKVIDEIEEKNKYLTLQKLTKKYCISGEFHKFIKNKKGENICKLCNKSSEEKYSEKELDSLNKNLFNKRMKLLKKINDLSKDNDETLIKKLEDNYEKTIGKKTIDDYLMNFINKIEDYITELETKNVYLKENVYIIDHTHDGNKLDKPIILTDKDNRIIFKQKHQFFKSDVLTYSFNKSGTNKIEVFYDAITKILLGYKETSRDYVINFKTENRIRVNYSLFYKLKYLGFESNFIDIHSKINKDIGIEQYKQLKDKEKEDIVEDSIYDISRERIKNLKKVIYELQRFINQIKNHYSVRMEEKKIIKKVFNQDDEDKYSEEEVEDLSHFEKVLDKYSKKLTEIKTSDDNKNYSVFEKWNIINDNLSTKMEIKDYRFNINIDETSKVIEADEIIKFDNNGNMLLYYIISEIDNLISFNTNKFIKTNLIGLTIELINYVFNLFNLEFIQSDISVKRLEYILSGLVFAEDLDNVLTEFGSNDEINEEPEMNAATEEDIEQIEDAREEAEALDVDGEYDYMSNYERMYEDNSGEREIFRE